MFKIAAVDIGSNAIRMQVTNVTEYQGQITFKKIEYIRFPLRLGKDVFKTGSISPENQDKFVKLMNAFKLLIELYEVDDYLICATSAMRESSNGKSLAQRVYDELGIKISIIDGIKEAELINKAIRSSMHDDKTYLHIDVGGGSTELNLYVNRAKVMSQSFKIGSVRRLGNHDSPLAWKRMEAWVKEHILKSYGKVTAIGTGGNINKIYELSGKKTGKGISLQKVIEIQTHIKSYNLEERINVLHLNHDRADVIIPASEIYISVMQWAKCTKLMVPDAGLKDGVMQQLYEKNIKQKAKMTKK